jgi:hypothetical protein
MSLHRNVSSIPLDGMPDGRQVLPGVDVELSQADLDMPLVDQHVKQGALVPVTMSPETPRRSASARTPQED